MGGVTRFRPKDQRIAEALAVEARQLILALQLPARATEDMLLTLARHENGGQLAEWKFNMLNPQQCLVIWDAIRDLSPEERPHQVRHLFDLVLTHIETNTGAVTLTREELAERISTEPRNVSSMMGTLERLGVIYRRRHKVPGMRGPGLARYYINPHVAWNGRLEVRSEQAREAAPPMLKLMEGGKGADGR